MASLEERFVNERQREADSDEEAERDLFAAADAATAERLRPVPDGGCMTGPKGVLKDRQRALEQEAEERRNRLERLEQVANRLAVGRQPDGEKKSEEDNDEEEKMSAEDIAFLKKYREQRLREMEKAASQPKYEKTFGQVVHLVHRNYTSSIDDELASVFVVIHIYDSFQHESQLVNKCLLKLARLYPMVKFCKILALATDLSELFKSKGIPALLIYQAGKLIGNYPQITTNLEEITPECLANFLKKNQCIPDVDPRPDLDDSL